MSTISNQSVEDRIELVAGEFMRVIELNVLSTMLCVKHAVPGCGR